MQPREFSALLIGCDLVKVANTSDGGVRVTLKTDKWDEFILGYVNKGEAAALGKCEATHHNKICVDALRDGTKGGKIDTSNYRQLSLLHGWVRMVLEGNELNQHFKLMIVARTLLNSTIVYEVHIVR